MKRFAPINFLIPENIINQAAPFFLSVLQPNLRYSRGPTTHTLLAPALRHTRKSTVKGRKVNILKPNSKTFICGKKCKATWLIGYNIPLTQIRNTCERHGAADLLGHASKTFPERDGKPQQVRALCTPGSSTAKTARSRMFLDDGGCGKLSRTMDRVVGKEASPSQRGSAPPAGDRRP
jgi:hypothetical protein